MSFIVVDINVTFSNIRNEENLINTTTPKAVMNFTTTASTYLPVQLDSVKGSRLIL